MSKVRVRDRERERKPRMRRILKEKGGFRVEIFFFWERKNPKSRIGTTTTTTEY